MALQNAAELQQFILKKVERTGKILGKGSFGAVEEMTYDHAPCAGKIIHEALVDSHNIGAAQLVTKFEQECKLLKELRYPHIVQFMGLCFFDECKSPVIVMELLNSNVEQWIIDANAMDRELPLSLKSSILRDTAKGLYHLHSHDPQIIHRDLTARNVLLTKSMQAKIADLGNAYIAPPQHLSKTMTRVPGTVPYMPPEAFHPKCPYTEKLDMFSFGHLSLYIMVQEEPYDDLLPPTYTDPSNPEKVLGRTEVERRRIYLDKLHVKPAGDHDVSLLIEHCLKNDADSRPSACQVIKVFDDLLKQHCDDYQVYDALNRYEFAQKLRDVQRMDDSGVASKVMSGQKFILQMFRKKEGKFRRGSAKWRQYTFCYTSEQLQYYTDLNKAPIQATSIAKLEGISSVDGNCVFQIQFKGNVEWILKADCQEEASGWIEALKPLISKKAPSTNLPAPPPPPPSVIQDADNSYEAIDNFTKLHYNEYEKIDPKSRDAPAMYALPPKGGNPDILKQAYMQDKHEPKLAEKQKAQPEVIPQAPVPQIIEESQLETKAESLSEKVSPRPERRLSKKYSAEQLDKVLEILQKVMRTEETSTNPPVSELYDDIVACKPSPPPFAEQGEWGMDTDNYVDMKKIDDIYDTIPDLPKQHFYFNIHDRPSLPPKPHPRSKSPLKVPGGAKPALLPRPDHLSKMGKPSSFDEILLASSKVSTDLLVLYDDIDDDGNGEDLYVQNTFRHRPDWAKASMAVVTSEELDKYGLEDEMLNLLTLNPSHLRNPVAFASGNFGDVFRATLETSDGKGVEVAIKSVKHETPKEKQNFVREMCVMSRMLHPNIVRLYGLVLKENLIVLEYMYHGDLGTFLKNNDRPVSKLILYMMDIGLGMHHISTLGLVHRDLAARNVLVGLNETCKVADFGLLRQIDDGCYLLTGASKVAIRWCAPECLKTRKFYPASDVWSYGIVLREMAYPTEIPYKEYNDYEVGGKIIDGEKMAIPYRYPETVQKIMKACWCYKPERRPSFQYITMLLTKLTFNKQ